MKTYRVKDWDRFFETSETRKVKYALNWVGFPTKHDGKGFRRMVKHRRSVQVFCAWCLIVQVAAKMPTRGVLHDGDGALTPEDLSLKTGFPENIFSEAMEALSDPAIGWLEVVEGWSPPEDHGQHGGDLEPPPADPRRSAEVSGSRVKSSRVESRGGGPSPPVFRPVPAGLFRREYEAMVRDAEAELKRVKADPAARAQCLSRSVEEMIEYLKANQREGWEERVKELRLNPKNYEAGDWTPAAAASIAAWKGRIQEIKAAMNGVEK